jgi:hypothetical protein
LNFQEEVKNTLNLYKKDILGIQDAGFFRYRGKDLLKEHILPTKFKTHNILHHYRDSFFSSSSSQINFHKYFHHLNSSQALCINLFFPLMLEGKLDLILDLLEIQKNPISETHFEKESEIETGKGRKTNFDFYMQMSNDTKVYFEIKYSETEFGKAKNDAAHRIKYDCTYRPLLTDNPFIKHKYKEMEAFFDSYQILRNLCYINENNFVVFVYPLANKKIHLQAQSALEQRLTDEGKSKFKILPSETIIDDILLQVQTIRLQEHYNEFKIKYLGYDVK